MDEEYCFHCEQSDKVKEYPKWGLYACVYCAHFEKYRRKKLKDTMRKCKDCLDYKIKKAEPVWKKSCFNCYTKSKRDGLFNSLNPFDGDDDIYICDDVWLRSDGTTYEA